MCHEAGQSTFFHTQLYLSGILIIYSATFLGTNSISVLMCRKVVNQSILIISYLVTFLGRHTPQSPHCCTSLEQDLAEISLALTDERTSPWGAAVNICATNNLQAVLWFTNMFSSPLLRCFSRHAFNHCVICRWAYVAWNNRIFIKWWVIQIHLSL